MKRTPTVGEWQSSCSERLSFVHFAFLPNGRGKKVILQISVKRSRTRRLYSLHRPKSSSEAILHMRLVIDQVGEWEPLNEFYGWRHVDSKPFSEQQARHICRLLAEEWGSEVEAYYQQSFPERQLALL